jgi:hypothetical protein
MTEPWFSDVPRSLAFLSLLAILAWPAEQGRFKTAIMTIWIAAMIVSGMLLTAAVAALLLHQPFYVVRTLTLLGLVFGFAFGFSFPALRRGYREAELRKMIAADL